MEYTYGGVEDAGVSGSVADAGGESGEDQNASWSSVPATDKEGGKEKWKTVVRGSSINYMYLFVCQNPFHSKELLWITSKWCRAEQCVVLTIHVTSGRAESDEPHTTGNI